MTNRVINMLFAPIEALEERAVRDLVRQADVVFSSDAQSDKRRVLYGHRFLEQFHAGAASSATQLRVLRIGNSANDDGEFLAQGLSAGMLPAAGLFMEFTLDKSTTQLDYLRAALMHLKGSCEDHEVDTPIDAKSADDPSISRRRLPAGIRVKLAGVWRVIGEAMPLSFEKWVDHFRQVADPGWEAQAWTHMADCYRHFTEERSLNIVQKMDIMRLIVATSTAGAAWVGKNMRPHTLPARQVREIAAYVEQICPARERPAFA